MNWVRQVGGWVAVVVATAGLSASGALDVSERDGSFSVPRELFRAYLFVRVKPPWGEKT